MTAYRIADISKPRGPVSRAQIFRDIKAGRLVARKVGAMTIILADDYRRYLEGRVIVPTGATGMAA